MNAKLLESLIHLPEIYEVRDRYKYNRWYEALRAVQVTSFSMGLLEYYSCLSICLWFFTAVHTAQSERRPAVHYSLSHESWVYFLTWQEITSLLKWGVGLVDRRQAMYTPFPIIYVIYYNVSLHHLIFASNYKSKLCC
jgi:hypothetical protein